MKAAATVTRPCERRCLGCEQWKHHSRFRTWTRRHRSISTLTFADKCKDCEQIERNERKNDDRAFAIIERRTADHARRLGVPKTFLWLNMNWSSLVPEMRALMTDEGRCRSCGHGFVSERDIQIEHREPFRFPQDWARQHARNLGIFCQSCNNTKGNKPYARWLDEQEAARLSNEHWRATQDSDAGLEAAIVPTQMTIDEMLAGITGR